MNNRNADALSRAGKEERAVATNQFVAGGGWSVMEWERASPRNLAMCAAGIKIKLTNQWFRSVDQ